MIRIFLVHDDGIVLEQLQEVVSAAPDITVVGTARNADQALAALRTQPVDVIVMGLPAPRDVQIQPSAHQVDARLPLAIFVPLPGCTDDGHPGPARAVGCLCSDAAGLNLCAAVRTVYGGEPYLCPYLAPVQEHMRAHGQQAAPCLKRLTQRELQLFRQLAAGKPNREIARALGVSAKTVSAHRMNILAKLGLHSNVELARLAFEQGLLTD